MTGFVAINFHNHFLMDTMPVASSLFVLGIMHSYRAEILTCSHSLRKFDLYKKKKKYFEGFII